MIQALYWIYIDAICSVIVVVWYCAASYSDSDSDSNTSISISISIVVSDSDSDRLHCVIVLSTQKAEEI